jgi:hypothetical protein
LPGAGGAAGSAAGRGAEEMRRATVARWRERLAPGTPPPREPLPGAVPTGPLRIRVGPGLFAVESCPAEGGAWRNVWRTLVAPGGVERWFETDLDAGTAVRLAGLFRYATGISPLDGYQLEFGKVGTPGVVLDDLSAGLTAAIEELTRPVDAIKHQAKTVTVGISRSDESLLEVPLVSATLEPCSLQPAATVWLIVANWPEAVAAWVALSSRVSEIVRSTWVVERITPVPRRMPSSDARPMAVPMMTKLPRTLSPALLTSRLASWTLCSMSALNRSLQAWAAASTSTRMAARASAVLPAAESSSTREASVRNACRAARASAKIWRSSSSLINAS